MKLFACIAHCLQTGIALNNSLDWTLMDISVFSLPVQVLPPVNFTLTVSALAQVLLQWEPNPAQEQNNSTIRYDVKILSPEPEEVREKNKSRILKRLNPCWSLLSKPRFGTAEIPSQPSLWAQLCWDEPWELQCSS